MSDDGAHAFTVIVFVGSVFSPYYAFARRRAGGAADATHHVAINVALYGGVRRWTMTERGRRALERSATRLHVGPSRWSWEGDAIVIDIDERSAPTGRAVRGRIRIHPQGLARCSFALDSRGLHRWQPIAPRARVEVDLKAPSLRWSGHGYVDSNLGERPLEADFDRWDWSRGVTRDGRSVVLYDVCDRHADRDADGLTHRLSLRFRRDGSVESLDPAPRQPLPRSGWRIARGTRCDRSAEATVLRTLEDTPFYARSLIRTRVHGDALPCVHESLSLGRFCNPVVQAMLPFRMPRRAG